MQDHTLGFRTCALHAGTPPDPTTGARAMPMYLSSSFVFDSTEHAAELSGTGRADIFAERGDAQLIVEMKRPERFRTKGQRDKASSDGNTLVLEDGKERYVHQLVGGTLLAPDDRKSPLDLGAGDVFGVSAPSTAQVRL